MLGGKGIDNYGLYPLGLDPIGTLKWALKNNAEGVAFSGLDHKHRSECSKDYLREIKQFASDNGLYLEWGGGQHIPRDMQSWAKKGTFENNRQMAEEARLLGTNIIRSCSGGLMRWDKNSPPTYQLMEEMAEELGKQVEMLNDYGVVLAIETHFEFTTFELIRVFESCGTAPGGCLGICLDTMNLLTMLEDPLAATERILPWVVSTHLKDGAVIMDENGLKSYPCLLGEGIVEIAAIIERLAGLERKINLNIEDHGGEFDLPVFDPSFLQEFTDLSTDEFVRILELAGKSNKLREAGRCSPMPRDEWPSHCEERINADIIALKRIVNG